MLPARSKPRRISRLLAQRLDLGGNPQLRRRHLGQCAALAQGRGQAPHLVPMAQAPVRLHQHALGGNALGLARGQLAQYGERVVVAAIVEQQAGLHRQPSPARLRILTVGAREPLVAPLDLAHFARGARRNQGVQGLRLPQLVSLAGRLLGAGVAPLEQGLQRGKHRRLPFFAAAAHAEGAHIQRQPQCVRDQAQQQIAQGKRGHAEQDGEVERKLGAVRRKNQNGIAVVQMRGERQTHRQGKHCQHPHQAAHLQAPPAALTAAPFRAPP